MGFLDVLNWREVGSVSLSALCAAVLGDQAVNVVGQDPGLTARNPSHGELTAVDQSPDRPRGDVQTPRDPACGIHGRAVWNITRSPQKNHHLLLAYEMFGWLVPKTKSYSLIRCAGVVPPSMSIVHEWSVMIRKTKRPEFLTEKDSIPYAAMS